MGRNLTAIMGMYYAASARLVTSILTVMIVLIIATAAVTGSFARPTASGINEEFRARKHDALEAKAMLADKLGVKYWVSTEMPEMPMAKTLAVGVDEVAALVDAKPLGKILIKLSSSCKKNMLPSAFTKSKAEAWIRKGYKKPYGSAGWRKSKILGDFFEPHYAKIEPEIFAEERLPINCYNYQFFVAWGRVFLIQRFCEESTLPVRTFFGRDLRPDPEIKGLKLLSDPRSDISALPPTAIKMREWAEQAGVMFYRNFGIELARIDFFHVPNNPHMPEGPGKAYFNEFTFSPAAFHLPLRRRDDQILGERIRNLDPTV